MYELAKSSREKMKAKARRLAGERDEKVDSSDWSPAPQLRADVKTGARPIMKPSAKGVGESNAAADTKAAIGDIKRGAYKSGGAVKSRTKKNLGGVMEVLSPAYGLLRAAQRGGRDEERDANEQMKGAMMANLGQRKSGGGVYDKKALGAIDPRAKREATPKPYKKGGRIKREDGGKLPDPYEAMRSEERMGRMKVEEKRKQLPPPKEAAESAARTGDMPAGRKHGGKKIAKKKGGSVGLTVVIADKGGRQQQAAPMVPPMPRGVPMPMPAPAQGAMGAPGPAPMMPPGAVGAAPPAQMPMMRKAGGRVTKVASSYKDMEAGAVSGEGRLQKTDIAKLRKGAPARKDGGRISKVAKSYKDMTAGAGDGEGRLQKTDIAKAKKVRAA